MHYAEEKLVPSSQARPAKRARRAKRARPHATLRGRNEGGVLGVTAWARAIAVDVVVHRPGAHDKTVDYISAPANFRDGKQFPAASVSEVHRAVKKLRAVHQPAPASKRARGDTVPVPLPEKKCSAREKNGRVKAKVRKAKGKGKGAVPADA